MAVVMVVGRRVAVPRAIVVLDNNLARRGDYISPGSVSRLRPGWRRRLLERLDYAVADPLIPQDD